MFSRMYFCLLNSSSESLSDSGREWDPGWVARGWVAVNILKVIQIANGDLTHFSARLLTTGGDPIEELLKLEAYKVNTVKKV